MNITKKELTKKIESGMNLSQISRMYKISYDIIYRLCIKYKIETIAQKNKKLYFIGKKICNICKKTKLLKEFSVNERKENGTPRYHSICKTCKAKINNFQYTYNKKYIEKQKKWREDNKKLCAGYMKKSYQKYRLKKELEKRSNT
jgi:hypothetical protein